MALFSVIFILTVLNIICSTVPVHWKKGDRLCKGDGSHYAVIHSEEDDQKVYEYCRDKLGSHCFFGLYSASCEHDHEAWTAGFDGYWTMADGTMFHMNDTNVYQNWCKGYPQTGINHPEWGICDGGVHVLYDVDEKCWKNAWDGYWAIPPDPKFFQEYVCQHHLNEQEQVLWYEKYWGYIVVTCILSIVGICNLVILCRMRKIKMEIQNYLINYIEESYRSTKENTDIVNGEKELTPSLHDDLESGQHELSPIVHYN